MRSRQIFVYKFSLSLSFYLFVLFDQFYIGCELFLIDFLPRFSWRCMCVVVSNAKLLEINVYYNSALEINFLNFRFVFVCKPIASVCVFALLFLFIVAHVFDNNFSFFSSFCIICKLHDFTIKFVFFWMAKTKTAATTARNSDRKLKIDDFDSNKVRISRFSSPLSQRNFRFSTEKCKKFSILEKHFYFRFLSFLSI